MAERTDPEARDRTPAEVVHLNDLRQAIAASLARKPGDGPSLRAAVWTYVGVGRHWGLSQGHAIMALTGLIKAAKITLSVRARRVHSPWRESPHRHMQVTSQPGSCP